MRARRRPRVLVVVSSSCQLYSGTGTALFDWMRMGRDDLEFSLLIDTGDRANFQIARRVCLEEGFLFFPSAPELIPGCPDAGQADAARVLRSQSWDYVECVSWASAATNLQVLANRPPDCSLLYTPHSQPIWTLPTPERFFMVQRIFAAMLQSSDQVFLDTPTELEFVDVEVPAHDRMAVVPLGVDTSRFRPPDSWHHVPMQPAKRILSVFDFREHRKRPDLLILALESLGSIGSSIELHLAGKGSASYPVPPHLERHIVRHGYVGDDLLPQLYGEAAAFVLLSDWEAFGLPIAEALCCGTPVVSTRLSNIATVYEDLPGVSLVDNADVLGIRNALQATLAQPPDRERIAAAARARFGFRETYGRKLEQVLSLRKVERTAGRAPGIGGRRAIPFYGANELGKSRPGV